MSRLKSLISNFYTNLSGINISQKIVVIESDDWGSIRMPNKNVFNELLKAGIPVDKSAYCKFDTLENEEDVTLLLEVLSSVKNREGENPILTANFVVANPDFQKIKASKFEYYYKESIYQTYKRLSGHEKVLDIIHQGLNEGLIKPQFHGREHVNIPLWLELLQNNQDFKLAFDHGVWGLSKDVFPYMQKSIQATYDSEDFEYCKNSIKEGLILFKDIFGFLSKSFIANNYIWPSEIEQTLFEGGVKHLQGMKYQLFPMNIDGKRDKRRIYFGQKNKLGMTYGVRNCSFEPIELGGNAMRTLRQINVAFMLKKPAIISTHRINFSGGINKNTRNRNLKEFKCLLDNIVTKWPDVVFMSSDQILL
ncbi:MAG: hypothetical protein KGZ81_06245 [Flavobacteriales bacterium]|nr:hypothetical protein [Flavobacteriales bacterium]